MANKNNIKIKVNDKIYFINKESYNRYKKFIKDKEIEFENNAHNAFKTIDKIYNDDTNINNFLSKETNKEDSKYKWNKKL